MLHGFTTSSDSGALVEIICLSVNVEKNNTPTEHTKDWKSALGCQAELKMLVIVYEVINRHQPTAQPSFGKWGKRYSPVMRISVKKIFLKDALNPNLIFLPSPVTLSLVWCIQATVPLPVPFCHSYRVDSHCCTKNPRIANPTLFMWAINCRPQQVTNFPNKLGHDDLQGMIKESWSFWQRGCTGCPFEVPCSTLSYDSACKAPFIRQHLWQRQCLHSSVLQAC